MERLWSSADTSLSLAEEVFRLKPSTGIMLGNNQPDNDPGELRQLFIMVTDQSDSFEHVGNVTIRAFEQNVL